MYIRSTLIQMPNVRATFFSWRNSDNIEMIPLCFLNQFLLFSCEGEDIPIAQCRTAVGDGLPVIVQSR